MKLPLKSAVVGVASGVLAFALLSLAHAQQQLTPKEIHQNIKSFVGRQVTVTGLSGPVRHEMKKGEDWVSFGIYEQDAKGKKRPWNIWVHLPVSAFSGQAPTENSSVSVTGTLEWPWSFARIGD